MNPRAYDLGIGLGTVLCTAGAGFLAGWAWSLVVLGSLVLVTTVIGALLTHAKK
jgi:hypothetical protein